MRLILAMAVLWTTACLVGPRETQLGTTGDSGVDGGGGLRPDLMILIDKSGSMAQPSDPTNAVCPAGCGPDGVGGTTCPSSCPTRIAELRTAMNTFLTSSGTIARMGMAIFPTVTPDGQGATNACGPTVNGDVMVALSSSNDVDAELNQTALTINNQVQQLKVNGGTPTGDSLRFLGSYAPLLNPDRADYVLLLTDGIPNCNTNNVNDCNDAAACRCTTTACTPTNGLCKAGCLDRDRTADAIAELRLKQIKVIVVGFGSDAATGDGPAVLNALAEAGGLPRLCPDGSDSECGAANTCDTASGMCTRKYYQAADAAQLTTALADIARLLR